MPAVFIAGGYSTEASQAAIEACADFTVCFRNQVRQHHRTWLSGNVQVK